MSSAALMAAAAGAFAVVTVWEAAELVDPFRLIGALQRVASAMGTPGDPALRTTLPERIRLVAVVALVLAGAGWLLAGAWAAGCLAAAGPLLPARVHALRRRRWRAELSAAAPAFARSLADALAAGHSVRAALAEVARASAPRGAAGVQLRASAAALALGAATERVLEDLRRAAACPRWDVLVAAVLLQRGAGGDLAALLRDLAAELEAGARVEADARAATAQARFTGWVVAGLPVAGAALAELATPGTLAAITRQPLAALMAVAALVLQVAGVTAIRRLATPMGTW